MYNKLNFNSDHFTNVFDEHMNTLKNLETQLATQDNYHQHMAKIYSEALCVDHYSIETWNRSADRWIFYSGSHASAEGPQEDGPPITSLDVN